jgi:hypothetical protein
MDLKEFLKEENLKLIDFCHSNDLKYGYLRHIANKRKIPSPEIALKIEQATHGKVTCLEILFPKDGNHGEKVS